jgi:hypothetical protein
LAVNFLCTRVTQPTEDDKKKLDRILGYLNTTADLGIILRPNSVLSVETYCDASYAVHADLKGHTGIYVTLGTGPVFVKSCKQKINSKSSTEAELIALADAEDQVLWSTRFLKNQGYKLGTGIIYQDNKSTMILASRGFSSSERTKHLDVRYFHIAENIADGTLELKHKPSDEMIADVLTKPLQGKRFLKARKLLLNL